MFFTPMAQHSAAAQFTPRREHTDAGFTGASQQQTGGRQPSANPLLFPGCGPTVTSPMPYGAAPSSVDLSRRPLQAAPQTQAMAPRAQTSGFTSEGSMRDDPPLTSLLDHGLKEHFADDVRDPLGELTPLAANARTPMPFSAALGSPVAERESAGYWVTAFGYHTMDMLPAVLEELQPSGGAIQRHVLGLGLWVHVCFGAKHEQLQALAKNGCVMHGLMLGVIEGIVPAGSAGNLQRPHATFSSIALKHNRGAGYTVRSRLQAAPSQAAGLSAFFNSVCEYAFGW